MKRFFMALFAFVFAFTLLTSCSQTDVNDNGDNDNNSDEIKYGKSFYVSPDGDDKNDGSESSPLATLAGARDAVRNYKTDNGLPDGGIEIVFKAGRYPIMNSVEFLPEDSGEAGKPIVYHAEKGAEVLFDGGVVLNPEDFVPAADCEVKSRIVNEDAKKALLEIDLAAAGCYDLVDKDEYERGSDPYTQYLYVDNIRQQVACWPNSGEYGSNGYRVEETGDQYLEIPEEKYELWKDAEELRYFGAPEIDWVTIRISEDEVDIDDETKMLVIHGYPHTPSEYSTVSVFNIPEELDIPGEYFWDTKTNKLYYYPDGDITGKKIVFSQLKEHMILLSGAKHLTFDGLTFENGRSSAIFSLTGDQNHTDNDFLTINNCVVRCMSTYGIYVFGNNITVKNSEFTQLGANAIFLRGGDRYNTNYIHINNIVTNNRIHDYAQLFKTDNFGIYTAGMGFTLSHNEIYNAPHSGIHLTSGETIIEYNHIHDVCQNTSDAGAIYIGRHWDFTNNIFRYNYIHDVADLYNDGSPCGIYLDDMVSDQHVYGNVLVDIKGCGIGIGGGKYNIIENNLIIKCGSVPITTDSRGLGFAENHTRYPGGTMWTNFTETNPYTDIMRFYHPQNLLIPELSTISMIYHIDSAGIGSNTTIRGNVAYDCVADLPWQDRDYGDIFKDSITADGVVNMDSTVRLYCTVEGNCQYPADRNIGFTYDDSGKCLLAEDSIIYRDILGFEKIPFEMIGLISD